MAAPAQVSGSTGGPASQDRSPWLQTPLGTDVSRMRILTLHKGSGDMPITCDLKVASLDDNPYYETLSYVWGDPTETRSINIGPFTFNATTNLFDFLHCLRLPAADRYLWADAACIDQLNSIEKITQVSLMSRIYQQAKESHIWFGPFNTTGAKSWESTLSYGVDYQLASRFSQDTWNRIQRECLQDLKYFLNAPGFTPLSFAQAQDFHRRCQNDILLETLRVLDSMASPPEGLHLYQYPVLYLDETSGRYGLTRSWPMVFDCILWLLTDPWWTRVWTLQEAVLPHVDPIVHAPPYSFKLSRIVAGISAMWSHVNDRCCKWYDHIILTSYRDSCGPEVFTRAFSIYLQRKSLRPPGRQFVPLHDVVHSIRSRKATEIRDYWYGIVGFLRPEWQEQERQSFNLTTAQLFAKCSKLIFTEGKDLTRLSYARRLRDTRIEGLPSWAIDISASVSKDDADFENWELYNASGGMNFELVGDGSDLGRPTFRVQGKCIGTVLASGSRLSPDAFDDRDCPVMVLTLIQEWHALYQKLVASPDENAFWRTVFMDRNPQLHWMHKRIQSLHPRSVAEIRKWWKNWEDTGDRRDLGVDRNAGDGSRGAFQYRAVLLAVEKTTFFITHEGVPGMGPHDIALSDELYVLRGCKALAVLRRETDDEMSPRKFVGLCFVDTWMYGKATQNRSSWETLSLC